MPRPVIGKGLTVAITIGQGMNNPRIKALHAVFKRLDEHDQLVIEGEVWNLANNPIFIGHNFGPVAAFELIGCLGEWMAMKHFRMMEKGKGDDIKAGVEAGDRGAKEGAPANRFRCERGAGIRQRIAGDGEAGEEARGDQRGDPDAGRDG